MQNHSHMLRQKRIGYDLSKTNITDDQGLSWRTALLGIKRYKEGQKGRRYLWTRNHINHNFHIIHPSWQNDARIVKSNISHNTVLRSYPWSWTLVSKEMENFFQVLNIVGMTRRRPPTTVKQFPRLFRSGKQWTSQLRASLFHIYQSLHYISVN